MPEMDVKQGQFPNLVFLCSVLLHLINLKILIKYRQYQFLENFEIVKEKLPLDELRNLVEFESEVEVWVDSNSNEQTRPDSVERVEIES